MSEPTLLGEPELLELLRSLLKGWETLPPETAARSKDISEAQLVTVFGLAAHTHRLAAATDVLWRESMRLEAMPLIRGAMEHALTAQFTAQARDAVFGLLNDYAKKRNSLNEEIVKAGWSGADKLVSDLDDWGQVDTPTTVSARNFQQLCTDLEPGGAEAYALYRLLSGLSHAGGMIVDEYAEDGPLRLSVMPDKFAAAPGWLGLLCASVVWAGRAFDMITRGNIRREDLHQAAKKLSIKPELQLSTEYHKRVKKNRQAKRQS